MKYPRFRVMTVEGYPIVPGADSRPSAMRKVELSAHVHDSLHLYRLVATYRSSERVAIREPDGTWRGSTTIGNEGALQRAQDTADRLNALHRQWLHREHMRATRG
jgi:hypothetical protein